MKTELKLSLENAIQAKLDKHADDGLWQQYIHPELVQQMVAAAEQVFDAAQTAQDFLEQENIASK